MKDRSAPIAIGLVSGSVHRWTSPDTAYGEETPIDADERALMPEAMLRRAATLVWYVAVRHGDRAPGDVGGAAAGA